MNRDTIPFREQITNKDLLQGTHDDSQHRAITYKVTEVWKEYIRIRLWGFPGGSAGRESACSAGDLGSIPGLGRSPAEGKGHPPQYLGLENPIVHGVEKSWTQLSDFHFRLLNTQNTHIPYINYPSIKTIHWKERSGAIHLKLTHCRSTMLQHKQYVKNNKILKSTVLPIWGDRC